MVGETGTTWYLMLEILNLPATPNQQTCLNEKITNTNTHTHTHTHTHQGSEKGTICNPSKTKLFARDIT